MKNKIYPYYDTPEIKDLRELIEYSGTEYADKVAFHWLEKQNEKNKTYNEVKDDISALGEYFLNNGYRGKYIALIGENSYNWIITYFATVNSGNIIIPIDKECTKEEVKYFVEQSGADILVYSDDYAEEAEFSNCSVLINIKEFDKILEKGRGLLASGKNEFQQVKIDRDKMCTLVFTSGTTAEPKGVMLSHYNLAFDTVCTSKNLLFPDSTILVLPLHHTFGVVASVTMPMIRGASIFVNNSMKTLLSDIVYAKPKFISCVPLVVETFYKMIQEKIRKTGQEEELQQLIDISQTLRQKGFDVRRILFKDIIDAFGGNLELLPVGGAPLNKNCISFFDKIGIKIVTGYGISECSPVVSTLRNEHYDPLSVGSVHPGVEVRIVDNEIQVKGPIVFKGYYKNEVETRKVFDGEWFKTGDLGKLENEMLYITGRIKNLIILANGKNVSAEELESKLLENIPEITEVVIDERNKMITAEIYIKDAGVEIKKMVEDKVFEFNKNLPVFKHIGNIVFRDDEFPKTPTKKIKRR